MQYSAIPIKQIRINVFNIVLSITRKCGFLNWRRGWA